MPPAPELERLDRERAETEKSEYAKAFKLDQEADRKRHLGQWLVAGAIGVAVWGAIVLVVGYVAGRW